MKISSSAFIKQRSLPAAGMKLWGLQNQHDSRERLAVVVGDGFFQSFLIANGLQEEIPCTVPHLVPGRSPLVKFPKASPMAGEPLWDKKVWPRLSAFVDEVGDDFWNQIRHDRVNKNNKLFGFSTQSIQYEYRAYLWYYFSWVDQRLSELEAGFVSWPVTALLANLSVKYKISFVSFNYDSLLTALAGHGGLKVPNMYFADLASIWGNIPSHLVPVVCLHGTMDCGYHMGGVSYPRDRMWLRPLSVEDCTISSELLIPEDGRSPWPPLIPTLIPPGCQGDDVTIPNLMCSENASWLLSTADKVLVYGLSGDGVDEPEVTGLLNVIRPESTFVHVGTPGKDESETTVARWRRRFQTHRAGEAEFINALNKKDLINGLSAL